MKKTASQEPQTQADPMEAAIRSAPVSTLAQAMAGLIARPIIEDEAEKQALLAMLGNGIPQAPIYDLKDVLALVTLGQVLLTAGDNDEETRRLKSIPLFERAIQALEHFSATARETFTADVPRPN